MFPQFESSYGACHFSDQYTLLVEYTLYGRSETMRLAGRS